MRRVRSAAAGLLAGVLALSLVAAETPAAAEGAGTAETSLFGAQVTVTNLGDDVTARLMDITSSATTDGTPFASTGIVPIQFGGDTYGATGASSDGSTEGRSDGTGAGDLTGALGLAVEPVSTSATARADRALATVEAVSGQLGALLGAVGLDLDTTGVTSLATRESASATQGMTVSGLDLGLADLGLPADVLGQLGLDNILELLGALPGLLPADMEGVDDVLGLIDDLEGQLGSLESTAGPLVAQIEGATADLLALVGDVQGVQGLLTDLGTVSTSGPTTLLDQLTALNDDLADVGCALELPSAGDLADVLDPGGLLGDLDGLLDPDDVIGSLTDLLGDAVTCVQGVLDGLVDQLETHLGSLALDAAPVTELVDTITALVEQILAELQGLPGLLDSLPGLLEDAAAMDLLSVGAFDVGTTAIAGETMEDSSATVLCDAVDVVVLGTAHQTPDCGGALDGLSQATAGISAAVEQIAGILNALPLGDLVQVGELRADLFTDVVESVSDADGVITSTAGFNLLDLAIPSITLDPSQVTGSLGDLGLPVDPAAAVEDVLGQLEGALGGLKGALGDVGDLGLAIDGLSAVVGQVDTVVGEVEAALAGLGLETGLGTLTDQVQAILDQVQALLDELDLGSLTEPISTPGLELLIDPVATASFAAGAGDGTAAPAPTPEEPAPAPSEPTLPTTGGGLALLGVLAMAGAGALRRRDR